MLTADLVRAQVRKDAVLPRWLDPAREETRAIVDALLALWATAPGQKLGALAESLADLEAAHPDPLLVKGLSKLLRDRCEVETASEVAPETLRSALFAAAAAHHPVRPGGGGGYGSREAVVAEIAAHFGMTAEALEATLFADRESEQRITSCVLPTPDELVAAYNLALAQACLLRAREARVTFSALDNKRLRAILRAVKFHRLLVRAERVGEALALFIDGPLSLHHQTGRYGLQLAQMLPAIARAEDWQLEAEVVWHRGAKKGVPATFRLGADSPIGKAGRAGAWHDRGVWTSAEEEHLLAAFADLGSPWRLEPGLDLFDLGGRDLLAPDYRLVHEDGRCCHLELVWTWRQKSLLKRIELIRTYAPPNIIVVWARRGGVEGALEELGDVPQLGFKGVIQPKALIALAETIAIAPPPVMAAPATAPEKPRRRTRARSGPVD